MGIKKIIVIMWLGAASIWLATVITVSAMNAIIWLTSIGFSMPMDVKTTILAYYEPISLLLWLVFAVRLISGVGMDNWKNGRFSSAMISYPIHGLLFTIVASMLRSEEQMSWQTFLTVAGVVFGITVLYSAVVSSRFK